jgi:hypothetical protein
MRRQHIDTSSRGKTVNDETVDNIQPANADTRERYEKPKIKSGQAFEKVLLGSGCNFNFNISFSCSEPVENCA